MSYQEKTVWGLLISIILVFGYYFATALGPAHGGEVGAGDLVRLTMAVIAFVVVQVVYHIVIRIVTAVRSRHNPGSEDLTDADERDRLIEAKGERAGSLLLGTGVILTIASIIFSGISETGGGNYAFTPFLTAHALLLSLVVAEIGKGLTQVFHYRKGY